MSHRVMSQFVFIAGKPKRLVRERDVCSVEKCRQKIFEIHNKHHQYPICRSCRKQRSGGDTWK